MLRNKFSLSFLVHPLRQQQHSPIFIINVLSNFRKYSQTQQQQSSSVQPLKTVLNQFNRAGAHPDLISMIDPNKARENGKMLMELEQILQDRQDEKWRKQQAQKLMSIASSQHEEDNDSGAKKFRFWIKRDRKNNENKRAISS